MTWHQESCTKTIRDPSQKDLRQKPIEYCLKPVTATAYPVSQGKAAVVVIHVARPRLGPRSTPVGLAGEGVTLGRRLGCGATRFVRPRGLGRRRNESQLQQRQD